MSLVEIRPGETLMLVMKSDTPIGKRDVLIEVPWDELVDKLSGEKKHVASKRSKTPGGNLSRRISLRSRAIKTGTWSTSAPINRHQVAMDLINDISQLSDEQLTGVTDDALGTLKNTLNSIIRTKPILLTEDKMTRLMDQVRRVARAKGHGLQWEKRGEFTIVKEP